VGDRVGARDVVAESFLPGEITPVNLARLLSLPPADVATCMLKREGDRVAVGEPLARTKGIFGLFRSQYESQVGGTLESVSSVTGQVMIRGEPQPVQVKAYLTGEVVEVIPNQGAVLAADVTFVQGIFGVGGETFGSIRMACSHPNQALTADAITSELTGTVVIGGGRVTHGALVKGVDVGVSAIVSGGIDDEDLKSFLGHDLGVAITGSENIGLTLIITEGFGDIAMAERTWTLLESRSGADAAVNGATQIRAGVMRPEIVIPLAQTGTRQPPASHTSGYLEIGTPVRIIREPYFGLMGTVTSLPEEPQQLASGSRARVLEVQFDSGERVVVPRANVELIEG
jgi:hypothetical protein